MEAVIQKWGNSLGIRIPAGIARDLHLDPGTRVDISEDGDNIIIRTRGRKDLEEMIERITRENLHSEVSSSGVVGNEVW